MKNILLLISLTLLCVNIKAQELKRQKERSFSQIPFKNGKKLKSINEFHVLKSNKDIKHGEYVKYLHKNQIFEKGSYENDNKVGIWEYYDFDGNLSMKYNHDSNKVAHINNNVYSNFNFDKVEYLNKNLSINSQNSVDFIGGKDRFLFYFLYDSGFDFPKSSLMNKTLGEAEISFLITPEGKIIREKSETSISDELDQTSINTIRNVPDEFVPFPENEILIDTVKVYQVFSFN